MLWSRLPRRVPPRLSRAFQDFGNYSVILPQEPFVYGVGHITQRSVPTHILRPDYAGGRPTTNADVDGKVFLGGDAERRLRAAAKLAREVRVFAGSLVKPGITTNEIDEAVHNRIIESSAYPSPLRYSGFPRSCCTSVNNIITHGIPDDRPLENGDIVCVDITVYLNGYHGDTAETFFVGDVDTAGRETVSMANQAVEAGISACGPGRPFRDIGRAIHDVLRNTNFSASPMFSGHGIGSEFHRKPWIFHIVNEEVERMEPGHCFTIEPCIIQGKQPTCWIFPDGWTASTEDCARSAQTEHMVLITENGVEVLTR
ncbi:Methionine aminopeptidase [Mycena indigotica]|uniref:Methionine aminopeptidase n=1 Tax=Mycena indigotica TaxID=2126181 RepID=A0A8H6SX19_9AGAR|nr:Methionine aminopeptidase [Mycena indigotica]KAF7307543.1 Methionine aminopeptidase [Mycena indigotica]